MHTKTYDIIVSGAGLVGLTLASALHDNGFNVALIERQPFENQNAPDFDGRHAAISYGCFRLWNAIGIGPELLSKANPIEKIEVTHSRKTTTTVRDALYRGLSLGIEDARHAAPFEPLGYMIENRVIRTSLQTAVRDRGIEVYCPDQIRSVTQTNGGAMVSIAAGNLTAKLVLCAEGHKGELAKTVGAKFWTFSYAQTALVCTLRAEQSHKNTAIEHFTPNGPLALLPLQNNRLCLVWVDLHDATTDRMGLTESQFMGALDAILGDQFGKVELLGTRFSYPLSFAMAKSLAYGRIVLIGDSAHRIHPVAGQGLNLGLKDVAVLVSVLRAASKAGADIGSALTLGAYSALRYPEIAAMSAFTDACVRAFSTANPIIGFGRQMALSTISRSKTVRSFLTDAAGGALGPLPHLLKP